MPVVSKKKENIVCALTYSPASDAIKKSVKKHWHILSSDPSVGGAFKELPIFANKRADNIRDKVVKTYYKPEPHFLANTPCGNFPCFNCIQCNAMIRGKYFSHPHSGKKYPVKSVITCKTKFVVYLLKCPCGLGYVGKTTRELRIRISEHKSSIRNKDEKSSVARHFNEAGHDVCTLRFQGIEFVKCSRKGGNRDQLLLQREAFWIHTLQTEFPKGLNEELLLGCFL